MAQDVAIDGFDAVSFFQGAPAQGDAAISHRWNGKDWLFASAANRDAFAAAPERYAPQYGGTCAFAVGLGGAAPGKARVFSVVDNKLYFFAAGVPRMLWSFFPSLIAKGQANWTRRQHAS